MTYTTFATFGSGQLTDFNVNSMDIMLVAEDESELRQRLQEEPFNNRYCTTYDIKEAPRMQEQFGMYQITLSELLKLQKQMNQMTLHKVKVTTFKESGKYYDEWYLEIECQDTWYDIIKAVRKHKQIISVQRSMDWLIGMDDNRDDMYPIILKG